jgi:cytochrome b
MATKMTRFWRGLGKVTFWSLAALVAYLVYSNVEKETAFWLGGAIIIFAVNYEIQIIKEKLDSIQLTLDDLHRDREPPDF